MPNYEWIPSECSPKNYPVEIVTADLFYDSTQSVYIPHGKIVNNGWGELNSTHLLADNTHKLPVRLQIVWFSYTENKFYGGVFPLPSDTLAALFANGFLAPFSSEQTTYRRIIAGMAPNGYLSLWVSELGVTTQVTTLQAKEVDVPWEEFKQISMPREQFIEAVLQEQLDPKALDSLKKNGVPRGLWQKYNVTFEYEPTIITSAKPIDLWLNTFNGEKEYIGYEKPNKQKREKRALPIKTELRWQNSKGNKYSAIIQFNEAEVFAAFEKMIENKEDTDLRLQFLIADIIPAITVNLATNKRLLELKATDIRIYSQ